MSTPTILLASPETGSPGGPAFRRLPGAGDAEVDRLVAQAMHSANCSDATISIKGFADLPKEKQDLVVERLKYCPCLSMMNT